MRALGPMPRPRRASIHPSTDRPNHPKSPRTPTLSLHPPIRRSWRFLGRAAGHSHDLSWGVAQHVAKYFDIGEWELEGVDAPRYPGLFAPYVACV